MDYSSLQDRIPDSIYNQIAGVLHYGIDGPLRLSHLLGQSKEECGFTVFTENLNYSANALWSLFHTHFTDQAECATYARQPEKIANRIYANRMGNGDEASGDGWLYRGRGCLQVTGKSNYQALGTTLGIDLLSNPDLVATDYQLASAAWFFSTHNLWPICDHGVDVPTITSITHHVNGGVLRLSQRIQYTQEIYQELTGSAV